MLGLIIVDDFEFLWWLKWVGIMVYNVVWGFNEYNLIGMLVDYEYIDWL